MNNLYTFFMDYRGGTYITQVEAPNRKKAMLAWAENIDYKQIKYMGEKSKQAVKQQIEEGYDEETPVEGLKFVYCFLAKINHHIAIVDIIETQNNL